jgi:CRISPR/Cas system-associated exonuclease Cas4 (RecB family)
MLASEVEGKKGHDSGESCLFYVGVTRARDQLILSYADHYGKTNYKRSPFLDALVGGLDTERITSIRWEHPDSAQLLPNQETGIDNILEQRPSEDFINAMRPHVLSAAALEEYLRCPRKYAYSAIYHFAGEKDGYQLFWAATQRTVKEIHEELAQLAASEHTIPSQQEIKERYSQHWQELGGQEAPFATMYEEHGLEVVETIRRTLHGQEDVHWQLRPNYTVDIAGKQVHVHVDRVEQADEETQQPVKFVRTRFGQRKEPPAPDTRELLYTLAYRQHHPEHSVEVHSHNLSTGERNPIKLTDKKEQSLYQNMAQGLQELERNSYPAQPADANRCPTCPFFLICPAWP